MKEAGFGLIGIHFSQFTLSFFCQIARVLVVFFLTYIVNQFTGGVRYISFQEQLIMAYGGLRGAISFSLVFMISDDVPTKNTLLSATYIVILFTVFVQGCTIKPVVRYLNIRLARKEENFRMFNEFNRGMITHMSQGIEDLVGYKKRSLMSQASTFSKNYIRPILEKGYDKHNQKKPENRLMMIDREETLREQMRKSASTNSFKNQEAMEQMAEEGEITRGLLDEEENFPRPRGKSTRSRSGKDSDLEREKLEQETIHITQDNFQIRKLINGNQNNFYLDRNLTEKDDIACVDKVRNAQHHIRALQERAKNLNESQVRRRVFSKIKKSQPKKSTTQGLLLASMGSIGVQSIDAGDEDVGIEFTMPQENACQLYTINESMDSVNESSENPTNSNELEKA